eukprot:Gb_07355 [translate_table: standard]
MSLFFIDNASSIGFPLIHSLTTEEEAMAEPQPKVLKHESTTFPVSSSTLICSFMTSPQAGAPTKPVPTLGSFLSKDPTFRGLL